MILSQKMSSWILIFQSLPDASARCRKPPAAPPIHTPPIPLLLWVLPWTSYTGPLNAPTMSWTNLILLSGPTYRRAGLSMLDGMPTPLGHRVHASESVLRWCASILFSVSFSTHTHSTQKIFCPWTYVLMESWCQPVSFDCQLCKNCVTWVKGLIRWGM